MSSARTALETLAQLPKSERAAAVLAIGADALRTHWDSWAHPAQRAPDGDWRVWLLLGGRGFGKTRAGAEWVRGIAEANPDARIALVGGTFAEARAIMIEGESGLLAVAPQANRPRWEPARNRLVWKNGARAMIYSGESPDALRGPEHSHAWCDELAKWSYVQATWDNLQMGLRIGVHPRALVTTTPRPIALLRALAADPTVAQSRGTTTDNSFLPDAFVAAMHTAYAGTRLGRQELNGELIADLAGALWSRDRIENCRISALPALRRVVVAVDPPAGIGGDACGIIVAGLSGEGTGVVIADASVHGATPEVWARAVADAVMLHKADRVVAEANQGGAMVASVLRGAGLVLPVKLVHATRGKVARAEPVAALYEAGRVRHVGAFPALEDELCGLIAGGGYDGPTRSPDRADALVYALTELKLGASAGLAQVRKI